MTIEIKPPTAEDVLDAGTCGELKQISDEVYDTWRWGNCYEKIAHRPSDDTYWQITYRSQPEEGVDTDSVSEVARVYQHTKTVTITEYTTEP